MDCTLILDHIARHVPGDDNTYMGSDGLLHCSSCHGTREVAIELPGVGQRIMPCICRCMAQKRDQELQQLRDQEAYDKVRRMRSLGFPDSDLCKATFASDDRRDPEISDTLQRYAEHFRQLSREGTGLLLYGPVGTGKTYYAACVINTLIDQGYPALLTSFPRLINLVTGGKWEDRQPMIDHLSDFALVALDDLGVERQTDYVLEQMMVILDSLYRSGTPLIITTNHDPVKLTRSSDIRIQRIWDRLRERCYPIAVKGESRRKELGQATYRNINEILGI